MKIHNFSAGPAILPREVIEQAAAGILDADGSGLSMLELSHRGKTVMAVFEEAEALLREIAGITDDFAVLFLSGGASTQFYQVPMNLLNEGETAAYLDTGVWAAKAIKEAKAFGQVAVVASSKADGYKYIPKQYDVPGDAVYLHYTSNNTIYGTQHHALPVGDRPLVCDMSSDFLSRPIDWSRHDVVYAGAQKNLGPAGVTIVVIRRSVLGRVSRHLPSMLDYRLHDSNDSMYNTPPVYAVYVSMLTLRWIKAQGGLTAIEKHNMDKAALLYKAIDESSLFVGVTAESDRSLMNVTFIASDPDIEKPFLDFVKHRGIDGIKGHRSVGGFRASIYNAMPFEGVEALVAAIKDFR
jgi:phosphoserine aminotransferase